MYIVALSPVKSEPPRAVVPLISVAVAPWFFLVALFDHSRGDAVTPVSDHMPALRHVGRSPVFICRGLSSLAVDCSTVVAVFSTLVVVLFL